uniref:Meiotic driver SPOK4 n=1 Tax=Podospora anserina TaxID=2587412 RepID=SPOK4_PODAS|nr:RecName: Full=Meiotic driver SPOK4; AltName: Full=Spore killer 4 [Podospora anserina]QDO72524.1 spore killer protein 4 [Podospora anserina]
MSDKDRITQLLRKLEEAKAREEEAKAREAQERCEKERLQLEHRKTTFLEYLRNCHRHLYNALRLTDTSRSSTGYTKVVGKYYPKRLRPWTNFTNVLHPRYFDLVQKICGQRQLFEPASTTKNLGTIISDHLAGNEKAIDRFEVDAVERPVQGILKVLATHEEAGKAYRCPEFRFSANLRELTQEDDRSSGADDNTSDGSLERRQQAGPNKRPTSKRKYICSNRQPDGVGIRMQPGGGQTQAFIYDYKAAHKVAIEHVRSATAKEHLFHEVVARINDDKLSRDEEVQRREQAEAFIAMALTQVFDYMITYGVSYGYVAAGRCLLLLYVDRDDWQTLYCHPCLPADDVGEPTNDWTDRLSHTAVAQLVSFCLSSFQSEALEGQSLETALSVAKATLKTWSESYADVAYLGLEPPELSSAASSQNTENSEYTSEAKPTGRKVALRSQSSCKPAAVLPQGNEHDEHDEDHSEPGASRSRLAANKRKRGPSSGGEDEDIAMADPEPTRQYCTQACLLGLKRGKDLDENCPNVSLHRFDGSSRHPVNAHRFTDMVKQQLLLSPYKGCRMVDFWDKRGAMGWLFKLELFPYGYTFVGKGTLEDRLSRLEHEGRVYARLDHLQGDVVPVHLGLVRLDRGYILPGLEFVVYMMLMSWAGQTPSASMADAETLKRESLTAIWSEGVDHGDDNRANYLWNAERCRIMIIDFDRAHLFPPLKARAVSRLSKPKRKRETPNSYLTEITGREARYVFKQMDRSPRATPSHGG